MNNIANSLIFSALLLSWGCKTAKNAGENTADSRSLEINCKNGAAGNIKDMTGLDGCGFMIDSEKGNRYNPINLNEFEIELKDGQSVRFEFESVDVATVCMSGRTVRLLCIAVTED